MLPDEQDESEEARKTSKKIKNEIVILLFFSLKRNLHDLWKIKMRPYLTEFHLKIVADPLFPLKKPKDWETGFDNKYELVYNMAEEVRI